MRRHFWVFCSYTAVVINSIQTQTKPKNSGVAMRAITEGTISFLKILRVVQSLSVAQSPHGYTFSNHTRLS